MRGRKQHLVREEQHLAVFALSNGAHIGGPEPPPSVFQIGEGTVVCQAVSKELDLSNVG
jgi:hypothetical protein